MTTHGSSFQRFQSDDPASLAQKVAEDYTQLADLSIANDELRLLEILSRLGPRLTILGREKEAAPLLEQALSLSRRLGEKRQEVVNLLNLATAQQYLGQRDRAQELFQEALDKARANEQFKLQYEDFILQHRGRCFVEQRKLEEARACFEQALALRMKKGDQRGITSTRQALDALEMM